MSRKLPPTQIHASHANHLADEAIERQRRAFIEADAAAREAERVRLENASHAARTPPPTKKRDIPPKDSVTINGTTLSMQEAAQWMSRF